MACGLRASGAPPSKLDHEDLWTPSGNLQGQHTYVLALTRSYLLGQCSWVVKGGGNQYTMLGTKHKEGIHTTVVGRPGSATNSVCVTFETLLNHVSGLTQNFTEVPSSSDTDMAQTVQELKLSLVG